MPRKGQTTNEETKARQQEAARNRKPMSEETRAKIAENSRKMHAARSEAKKQEIAASKIATRKANGSDEKLSERQRLVRATETEEQKRQRTEKLKSVYTDEKRVEHGEITKEIRALESEEVRNGRIEKYLAAMTDEKKAARSQKISETRLANQEKFSLIAKKAWDDRSADSKEKNKLNMAIGHEPWVREIAVQTRAPYQHEINSKIASSVQDDWANMPLDVKIARVKAALGIPVRDFVMVDGSIGVFRSSWEADLANVLISLGIDYLLEVPYEFGGILYLPDFYLPEYDCIIEVKGHPKAWERWNDKVLPAIEQDWNVPTSIYILDKSIKKQIFGSFSELQKQLDFVV